MPGDLDYTAEKFAQAAHTLALLDELLRNRLVAAYTEISHAALLKDGAGPPISDELARKVREFHARMTHAGSIEDTVASMSGVEVHECTEALLDLADALALELADERRSTP